MKRVSLSDDEFEILHYALLTAKMNLDKISKGQSDDVISEMKDKLGKLTLKFTDVRLRDLNPKQRGK